MSALAVGPAAIGERRATADGVARMPTWLWIVALVAVAGLAYGVRLTLLTHGGGLDGSDAYDDGVYYSAADALVHGRLPYRDFVFLQPPGVLVVLAPFAWLGSVTTDPTGVVAARLCFIGVGALNTVLVMLLGRRFGGVAAVLAGIGYAVFLPAAYSERSTLLEPVGTLGLLLAALLIDRTRFLPRLGPVLAGAAAGVAMGLRLWYVVPAALIALVNWRATVRFVAGATAVVAAIYLPFLLTAPPALIRQVVFDQVGRSDMATQTPLKRLDVMVGAVDLRLPQPWEGLLAPSLVGAVLLAVTALCTVAALRLRGARRYPVLMVAGGLVLLASPSYFLHYPALTAPWFMLTISVGATWLLRRIPFRAVRFALAAVLALGVVAFGLRAADVTVSSYRIATSVLGPVARHVDGCVMSDDPQVLAGLDVLSSDLRRGCEFWPDVTGVSLDRDAVRVGNRTLNRFENARWQADIRRYLLSGSAVVIHRRATDLGPADLRAIRSGRILAHTDRWRLYGVRH